MGNEQTPQQHYGKQLEKFTKELQGLQKRRSQLGWARLAVFVLTILIAYQFFTTAGLVGLIPTVVGIGLLLFLVSKDVANNEKIRNAKNLVQVNEEELQALDHKFLSRDNGAGFLPAEHTYANDLDLFGQASIYQWLSRCYTQQGRRWLADNLLQPVMLQLVQARQTAVKDLASKLDWRQQWQAFAMQNPLTSAAEEKVKRWLQEEEKHFLKRWW
ncbi:MAG TPA: hypothetical protein VFL47_16800, partial [Flavisolibacter sp.]|nr:hypothetical protein [Flavisolibacter sp.]